MITLKSNYSPEAAPELQEADNVKMLHALLLLAGMSTSELETYQKNEQKSADLYNEALVTHGDESPTDEQWSAAIEASKPPVEANSKMLTDIGITVENKLMNAEEEGYFDWILSVVYNGFDAMVPVAQIERPIKDIESKSYTDNSMGFAAAHPELIQAAPHGSESTEVH